MSHNTRYEKGQTVTHEDFQTERFMVDQIKNADSDSPDYLLVHLGQPEDIRRENDQFWAKASEINRASKFEKKVKSELKRQVQKLSNQHAAVFQSNIMDKEREEGVDMIVAKFGDKIGVNGYEKSSYPDTSGYEKLSSSGSTGPIEEEVQIGNAIEETYSELDVDYEAIARIADQVYGESTGMVYPTVQGRIDRYREV